MNRESRAMKKSKIRNGDVDLSDPKAAREYVGGICRKDGNELISIFPLRMNDGRLITKETMTDEDVNTIIMTIAGGVQ